jgi:hypothetical protein
MSNNIDLELAPLVNEQVVSEDDTRTFSKSAKMSVAIGALLSLSAIAALSYGNNASSSLPVTTMDMSSNKAICKGTYVQGVTMRSAADNCAIISNGDMYGWDGEAMPTITYCVGSGDPDGTLSYDYASIKSHGELDLDNDGISGISPGRHTDVIVYSGMNFDGESVTIYNAEDDGRLWRKKYPSGKSVNDNVRSFKIVANVPDGQFAGGNCGQTSSVCMNVQSHGETVDVPPPGCIKLASVDPTGKIGANIKTATICSTNDNDHLTLKYDSLVAMNMIQRAGHKENQISYVGRGQQLSYVEMYEDHHAAGSNTNLQTGPLTGQKYPDGSLVTDNVNSIKFSSFAPNLVGCDNENIIM